MVSRCLIQGFERAFLPFTRLPLAYRSSSALCQVFFSPAECLATHLIGDFKWGSLFNRRQPDDPTMKQVVLDCMVPVAALTDLT